ncbi:hypothetical protein Ocin01_16305 [Orchesella cincta]|uniref:F-box domain-containing protein n=1 Tax=Orchesella cincta TaxID=48709 RepID=A0A1D2MBK0_ORCCI|nr:hypothetical protein Ocin01_16305 [Orchesella cincta]
MREHGQINIECYILTVFLMELPGSSDSQVILVPPSPYGRINDFPDEVLERIIDKLGDRHSKLNCRLINSQWRSAANSSMERELLSKWKTLSEPERSHLALNPFPVMPVVPFKKPPKTKEIHPLNFAYCPAGLTNTGGNPFPTKSLNISSRSQGKWSYSDNHPITWVKVEQFIPRFGSYLTSFRLEDVKLSGAQLNLMFKHLVNLKALAFSNVILIKKPEDESYYSAVVTKITEPPPPNLRYVGLRIKGQFISDYIIPQWILDWCGPQLVSLEATKTPLYPYQQPPRLPLLNESVTVTKLFKDLTRLRVYGPSKVFLNQKIEAPLKYLTVFGIDDQWGISLKDVVSFLDKFSNTLIYLYVYFLWEYFPWPPEEVLESVTYPLLKELHICLPTPSYELVEELITYFEQVFFPRFPNVESLTLLNRGFEDGQRETNFDEQHYFKAFPKLRTLTLKYNKHPELESTFTREAPSDE